MRSLVLFLGVVLTLASLTRPARAVPPTDAALAQVLFTSGKEAMSRGDLPTACGRFAESLKLDPAVGTLLNLATCEERSGKIVIALEHFTSARTQLPKDDFRVGFANERIAALTPRIARIVVRLPASSSKARVLRDGTEIDPAALAAGQRIAVDPGAHVIVVETQPAQRIEVTLSDGEEKVIDVPSPPANPPSEGNNNTNNGAPSDPASTRNIDTNNGDTRRTLAFVTAGVGVAGIATGIVTGLMTVSAASTYRAHCTNGECDDDGLSAASTGRTVRIISPVSLVVGGLFGVASVYLFVSGPSTTTKTNKKSVRLSPMASPQGGGVFFSGAF